MIRWDFLWQDLVTIWLNQQCCLEWLSSQADDLAEGDELLADVAAADQRMADALVRADRKKAARR
jgi:hypothetical protein